VSGLRLPEENGLGLQEAFAASGAPAGLVFLAGTSDIRLTVRAIRRGAMDVLARPVATRALLAAVSAALASARNELESRRRLDELRRRCGTLTPRERQVFALVTAGLLNKQVGFELGTTEKTVKVQRARVVGKMGAGSLPDLVRMADRLGLGLPVGVPGGEKAGTPRCSALDARAPCSLTCSFRSGTTSLHALHLPTGPLPEGPACPPRTIPGTGLVVSRGHAASLAG